MSATYVIVKMYVVTCALRERERGGGGGGERERARAQAYGVSRPPQHTL